MMSEHNDHNDDSWRSRAWSQLAVKTRQQELAASFCCHGLGSAEPGSLFHLPYPSPFNRNDFAQKSIPSWQSSVTSISGFFFVESRAQCLWKSFADDSSSFHLVLGNVIVAEVFKRRRRSRNVDSDTLSDEKIGRCECGAQRQSIETGWRRWLRHSLSLKHLFSIYFPSFFLVSREAPGMNYSRSWWILQSALVWN